MTTPTSKPVPSNDPNDLLFNAETLDKVINTDGTVTTRTGKVLVTASGALAQVTAAAASATSAIGVQVASVNNQASTAITTINNAAAAAQAQIATTVETVGFKVPVPFASGIVASTFATTVTYNGDSYFANPTATPFTTTATFNPAQWLLFNQDFGGSQVIQTPTYNTLRAYNGAATISYVAGRANDQDGAAGTFAVDEADTTSADNDCTILVDALDRRWKRQYNGGVYVAWAGAVGDGVTYDHSAIALADAANGLGQDLNFNSGKVYLVNSTVNIKRSGKLNLNGSSIKAGVGITSQMIYYGEQLNNFLAITPFTANKSKIEVTLPSGVSANVGDLIGFNSSTDRISGYKHGMWAIVVKKTGQDILLSTPFYDSFQVDSIEVWRGYTKMSIENGTLDLSNVAASANFTEGALIRGTNSYVKNVHCIGSEYAGIGVRTDGENSLIEGCTSVGFLNSLGEPSGGKIGYGFALYGNNSLIRNSHASICKHGVASAARSKVAVNVKYEDCTVEEDSVFVSSKYSGSFDMHPNVAGIVEINNCSATGQYRLLSLRCPVKVNGGRYIQTLGGQLIEGAEGAYDGIHVNGIEYSLATSGSSLLSISSASPVAIDAVNNCSFTNNKSLNNVGDIVNLSRKSPVSNLVINGNEHDGGSLFRHAGGNITGLKINDNPIVNSDKGTIRIFAEGGVDVLRNISVKRNGITRSNTGTEDINVILSTTATKVDVYDLDVSDNNIDAPSALATGYAIQLTKCNVLKGNVKDNIVSRGNFRAIQFGGCSLNDFIATGNITDGDIFTTNTAAATVLNRATFTNNIGSGYTIAVDGLGVTKTRYVEGLNNFATYVP